ncbi:MAG: glycosyltransferase family 4 protein [Armatimonadetes bacterium]|nr:glycosyltransferase family 4 protein [Armatimonadota bacterium]
MKIAINTLSENPQAPSGAFGYYQNLIKELELLIGNNTLYIFISRKSKDHFGPFQNPNVHKIVFRYSNERKWLRILTEHFIFPVIILKYRINVLNTGTSILFCPCKLVATLKTMHVYTNPETLSLSTRIYRKLAYKLTKWSAKAIISNSESQTRDIIKYVGIKPNKIHIAYEALDHTNFKPVYRNRVTNDFLKKHGISKPFILFVSSLYPYKNAETLIKAFAKLKNLENLQLAIVGFPRNPEYYEFLIQLVKSLNIEDSVVFTGGVKQTDTAIFYQSAEVFAYPSKYETFGLTILEAMACGCPVITSNISAMPEIGGQAAIYFNPENESELIEKMEFLLENEEEKKKNISLGLKRSTEFTWRSTAEKTYKVLTSCID